jgi:hypothetical protein
MEFNLNKYVSPRLTRFRVTQIHKYAYVQVLRILWSSVSDMRGLYIIMWYVMKQFYST